MPRRNEILNSNQAFWIKQENGKGYTVWSKRQLDKLLEEGVIGPNDLVQIRRIGKDS